MEVHSVAERRYCFMPCYGRPEVSVWQHRFKWGRDSQSHREIQSRKIRMSWTQHHWTEVIRSRCPQLPTRFWMMPTFVTNATIVVPLWDSRLGKMISHRNTIPPRLSISAASVEIIFRIYNTTRMGWWWGDQLKILLITSTLSLCAPVTVRINLSPPHPSVDVVYQNS